MSKNYSGSDLSREGKSQLSKWIREIKKVLIERGCTNLDFHYGFYCLSGFFTSSNGKIYYIASRDTRLGKLELYYRTAKDYRDYKGGFNNKLNYISDLKDCNF